MKVEGMKHLPPGQRAKLRQMQMLSRPVARSAGLAQLFPTDFQLGTPSQDPRRVICLSIHESIFYTVGVDHYIGGKPTT
jgi:hypothetical protein